MSAVVVMSSAVSGVSFASTTDPSLLYSRTRYRVVRGTLDQSRRFAAETEPIGAIGLGASSATSADFAARSVPLPAARSSARPCSSTAARAIAATAPNGIVHVQGSPRRALGNLPNAAPAVSRTNRLIALTSRRQCEQEA